MRMRRKNASKDAVTEESAADLSSEGPEVDETVPQPAAVGPVDVTEIDPEATYIDLGSLLIPPGPELELRLQVEEDSGEVLSVLLVADEGVLEVRAFASSRGGDLWSEARSEIASDTLERGGIAKEQEGPFGTELYCEIPVAGANDEQLIQPSRVIGHNGPRWFLRATIAGRPAKDPEYCVPFEAAIRSMAVRRGNEAMAPGKPLPLQLPPEARQMQPEPGPAE